MTPDRLSPLMAVALLCFAVGCGTGVRPPQSEPKPTADSFLETISDGSMGSYSMNLSDGSVSLQQRILILGYPAGIDPLGRFAWFAQQDVDVHGITVVPAPPTIVTIARAADGLFFDSDRRDYQPKIVRLAVEHHGRWAYDFDRSEARRIFSISPGDGHLEQVGITTLCAHAELMVLHPIENIFYGLEVRNFGTPAQETVLVACASDDDTGELKTLPNVSTRIDYEVREMVFTPDGRFLIVADFSNPSQVHFLARDGGGDLREVGVLTPKFYAYGFFSHPKLPIIYHGTLEGGAVLTAFGVENGVPAELPKIQLPDSGHGVEFLHVSSDGHFLLVRNLDVYLITLDPQTGAATAIQPGNFPQ